MPSGQAERETRVRSLVASALALPEAERELFLRAECGEDAAIIQEVRNRIDRELQTGGRAFQPSLSRTKTVDGPFEPGQTIAGRFRIVRQLGAGGMGVVYQAFDEKLDRTVALKCARMGHSARLPPEARAAREVSHYNICKVHDLHSVLTASGAVEVISMEYVEGETLAERLRTQGRLADAELRDAVTQICAGVAQAHRQGVIHGDLKPANVLLARTANGGLRVVVTDFGLASFAQSPLGSGGGTLGYMAPELLRGEAATFASDIYALGIMIHEMRLGTIPKRHLSGTTLSVSDAHAEPAPLQLSDLGSRWNSIVQRSVKTQPDDRYRSADEIRAELGPKRMSAWWAAVPVMLLAILASFAYVELRLPPGAPTMRLAIMPIRVDGGPIPAASGIARDIVSRLERAKANVIVISPEAALKNNVQTPAQARTVLAATHVLSTTLNREGDQVLAEASLVELASNATVGRLKSLYSVAEPQAISKALLATITSGLHLKSALVPESVNPAAYADYVQGAALLQSDKWDAALPYLQRANDLDPHSALPYAGLAEVYLQKFNHGDGRKWLDAAGPLVQHAVAINPDNVPVLLVSGLQQKLRGSYEEAVRQFSRATELEPSNSETWGSLAELYGQINRPDDAIAAYQKAIIAQPDYYANFVRLGGFYLFRAKYPEAAETYRRLIAIAPSNPSGHIGLGLALMEQGLFKEAESALTTGYNLEKTPLAALNLGALYYAEQRYTEALPFFERSLTKESDSITFKDLGDVYRKLGRKKDAVNAYQEAIAAAEQEVALSPRNSYARVLIGEVSAFLGDRRRAEYEVVQALALDPGNAIVKFEAVIAYEAMGERNQSLAVLENAPAYLLGQISRSPDAAELRHDPHFQELLHKP